MARRLDEIEERLRNAESEIAVLKITVAKNAETTQADFVNAKDFAIIATRVSEMVWLSRVVVVALVTDIISRLIK